MISLRPEADLREVKIDLGEKGNFTICVKPLTVEEMLSAAFADSPVAAKVRASIVDWGGVNDAGGKGVGFSPAALDAMCRQYPGALRQIVDATMHDDSAIDGDDSAKKNSPPTPTAGSGTPRSVGVPD